MYFAFDGLFQFQIAAAAKMTAKIHRVLVAQLSASRACSLSASSTCLGRRSFNCFIATSLSLLLILFWRRVIHAEGLFHILRQRFEPDRHAPGVDILLVFD